MATSTAMAASNYKNKVQAAMVWGLAIVALLTIGYWGGDINNTGALFYLGLTVLSILILGFGAFTWWLFFSPLPAGTKPPVVKPAGVLHQTIGFFAFFGGV